MEVELITQGGSETGFVDEPGDVHQCGRCRVQLSTISAFVDHRTGNCMAATFEPALPASSHGSMFMRASGPADFHQWDPYILHVDAPLSLLSSAALALTPAAAPALAAASPLAEAVDAAGVRPAEPAAPPPPPSQDCRRGPASGGGQARQLLLAEPAAAPPPTGPADDLRLLVEMPPPGAAGQPAPVATEADQAAAAAAAAAARLQVSAPYLIDGDCGVTLTVSGLDGAHLLADRLAAAAADEPDTPPAGPAAAAAGAAPAPAPLDVPPTGPPPKKRRLPRERKYECEICGHRCSYPKDLKRHQFKHMKEKFSCEECDCTYNRPDKLANHVRLTHRRPGDRQRVPCPHADCPYRGVNNSHVQKHLRDRHSDVRPYSCQMCKYSAKHLHQLTIHLRSHTGDCPYVCQTAKCQKRFRTLSDLRRHRRLHSGERPFKCGVCGFASAFKANLVKHTQNKHGSEAEKMEKKRKLKAKAEEEAAAGAAGAAAQARQKRRRDAAKRNSYAANHWCDQCGASFVREEAFNVHMTTHDPDSLTARLAAGAGRRPAAAPGPPAAVSAPLPAGPEPAAVVPGSLVPGSLLVVPGTCAVGPGAAALVSGPLL